MSGGYFFTIQDPMLAHPEMPTTYANAGVSYVKQTKHYWLAMKKKVQSISEHKENNLNRHAKKKQKVLDNLDIFLADKRSTHNTTVCTNHNPHVPVLLQGMKKKTWRPLNLFF
jgi:hypothetical protein